MGLAYQPVQVVLLYLDANQRIQFSKRCTNLYLTELQIPLKFHSLEFQKTCTIVNNISYSFGVYREYKHGESVPEYIKIWNLKGGLPRNSDRFGFETEWHEAGSYNCYNNKNDKEQGQQFEQSYRIYKEALKRRMDSNACGNQVSSEVDGIQIPIKLQNRRFDSYQEQKIKRIAEMPLNQILEKLTEVEADYLPHKYWREYEVNGIEPPFKDFLQLTITDLSTTPYCPILIHRFPYTIKLEEATAKLNSIIFAKRAAGLLAKNLRVIDCSAIPKNVRIKISSLRIHPKLLNSVGRILEASSFPLKVLTLAEEVKPKQDYFANEIVRNVQELNISNRPGNLTSWFPILTKLTDQKVHLFYGGQAFSTREILKLVKDWRKNGRSLGTELVLGMRSKPECQCVLRKVGEMKGAREVNLKMVSLPMANGYYLIVSFRRLPEPLIPKTCDNINFATNCHLVMRVCRGGLTWWNWENIAGDVG